MAETKEFDTVVVAEEVAKSEFENWLKSRRIRAIKRESLADAEKTIIEAIMYGLVEFKESEDGKPQVVQNLEFPLTNIDKIEYKNRITVKELQAASRLGGSDFDKSLTLLAKQTNIQNTALVASLEFSDYELSQQILTYFL